MACPDNAFTNNRYEIIVRQQPLHARISAMKISDRRPVDPPMVVQLFVTDLRESGAARESLLESKTLHRKSTPPLHLTNPYYFMYAALTEASNDNEVKFVADGGRSSTSGALVSSVRVLKDFPNSDQEAAFFIFPDICVRLEGSWRFKFTLFDLRDDKVKLCASTYSAPFFVYPGKQYPGVQISTPLTRALAAQGVRLRIRKEIREKAADVRSKDESPPPSVAPPSPDSSVGARSPPKRRRTLPALSSLSPIDYAPPPFVDTPHAYQIPGERTPSPVAPPFYELFNDSRFRRTSLVDANAPERRDWAVQDTYHSDGHHFSAIPPTPKSDPALSSLTFLRPAHPSPELTHGMGTSQIQRNMSSSSSSAVAAESYPRAVTYPVYSWSPQATISRDGFSTGPAERRFSEAAASAYWPSTLVDEMGFDTSIGGGGANAWATHAYGAVPR